MGTGIELGGKNQERDAAKTKNQHGIETAICVCKHIFLIP